MSAKSNWMSNALLRNIFNGGTIPGLAANDPAVSSLFISLHTASPGAAGTANTNEIAYTGYARVAVARSIGGWVVTDSSVSPAAVTEFGECTTAGTNLNATHVGISTAGTGAANLVYFGALDEPINIVRGTIPRINPTSIVTEA